MKNTFKLLFSFFILTSLVMTSCVKDDFDQPDIPNPCDVTSGFTANITVEGITDLFATLDAVDGSSVKIFPDSNIVLEATVVSNDEAGNFYKALYLEDATGAVMLSIEGSNLFNDYPVGQTVHLNLSGLTVEFDDWVAIHEIGMGTYLEAGAIKGIGRIPVTTLPNILKNNSCPSTPTPKVIDLLSFDNSNVGRLVKLENVQFTDADKAKTYADAESDPPQSVSLMIEDCNGNEIILRNSGYASFASLTVPCGKGSIVGVFTKYGSDYQLIIRDTADVQFTGTRCDGTDCNGGGGNPGDPVTQMNETFDGFSDYDDLASPWTSIATVGTRIWQVREYSGNLYANMSEYNSGEDNHESWAITPALDLDNAAQKVFSFESKLRYAAGATMAVYISSDFDGSDATAATWTQLTATISDQDAFVASGDIDLSAYSGTAHIGFKYVGSQTAGGQFQIDNVKFAIPQGGSGGGSGTGAGTFDDPYDVEAAISNNSGTGVWVTGYLVGIIETGGTNNVADLEAPFATATNVYIAPTASETDSSKMLIVQLPTGDIRTATNLVDNESLLGSEIKYRGDLLTYFGLPGLKNTNGYWLNGAGINPDYVDPGTIWSENFESSLGQFSMNSITGDQEWYASSFGSETYAKMSGYDGSNFENEDWLISSAIDLSGKSNVKLNIRQAVNFLDTWDNLKVLVSTDYTSDVAAASWDEITVGTKPAGDSWSFVDSEDIDLSAYDGETIYLAFKYMSTTSGGATWEIAKVVVKE